FFKSLPKELEEAASIDGASTFRTFRQIILPNAYPALAALAILRFQGEWNGFQWPLIVVRSPDHLTLPLGLASFQGLFGVNWNWVLRALSGIGATAARATPGIVPGHEARRSRMVLLSIFNSS